MELERTLLIICSEPLTIHIPGMSAPLLVKIENPYERFVIQIFLYIPHRINLSFLCHISYMTLTTLFSFKVCLHCKTLSILRIGLIYGSKMPSIMIGSEKILMVASKSSCSINLAQRKDTEGSKRIK